MSVPSSGAQGFDVKELPGSRVAVVEQGTENDPVPYQIIFENVFAYKCTRLFALTGEMLDAYDRILEIEDSQWLESVSERVRRSWHGPQPHLKHFMINFDDGPCCEFICENFVAPER